MAADAFSTSNGSRRTTGRASARPCSSRAARCLPLVRQSREHLARTGAIVSGRKVHRLRRVRQDAGPGHGAARGGKAVLDRQSLHALRQCAPHCDTKALEMVGREHRPGRCSTSCSAIRPITKAPAAA